MIDNKVEQINTEIPDNRIDTHRIYGAPQPGLTAQSGTPVGTDSAVIANTITRVGQIEARLKALGLLLP